MEPDRRDSGPPLPPGPGGAWPALLSAGLVAFLLAGFLTLGSLLEALRPGGLQDPFNLLLLGLAVFPLTLWMGLRLDPEGFVSWPAGLALRPARSSTALLALLFGVAAVLPLSELDNLLQSFLPLSESEREGLLRLLAFDGWSGQLAKVFAIAVVTPVGEELIFRGILLRWLRRSYGRLLGLAGSALLFGAAHLSLRLLLPVTLLGLFLGWLTDRSRSVLPAVATHAAYNAVPFLFPPTVAEVPGWTPAADTAPAHLPAAWVVGAAVACLVLIYGIWWTTLRRD